MIRLHLTVVTAAVPVDLVVDCPAGTTLGLLRQAVMRALGADQTGSEQSSAWFVAGVQVADEAPVGTAPLLDGVLVECRPRWEPAVVVEVVDGPGRGARARWGAGVRTIGRGADADLTIADPDMSRCHVRLEVRPGSDGPVVSVADACSTNGSRLVAARTLSVGSSPVGWEPPAVLAIGRSRVRLTLDLPPRATPAGAATALGARHAAVHPDRVGGLTVNPAPWLAPSPQRHTVDCPDEPHAPVAGRFPWPMILLPVLFAVPAALLWHQPALLVLGLLSPVLAVAQHLVDRRSRHSAERSAHARWAEQHRACEAEITAALAAERDRLQHVHPGLDEVLASAQGPGPDLWSRAGADALDVRVGVGERPGGVTVRRAGRPSEPTIADAPVTIDLLEAGVVGICGPPAARDGLARAVLGQAAVRASPSLLTLAVRSGDPAGAHRWAWTAWLPHARAATAPPGAGPVSLTVLDAPHLLRGDAEVTSLLSGAGRQRGSAVLCLADRRDALPRQCSVVVDVADGDGLGATVDRQGRPRSLLRPEPAPATWAHRLARALAPLRDATAAGATGSLGDHVPLLELVPTDPATIAGRWRLSGADDLAAVIGRSASGPQTVDLVRDGPHALVAGTTGAGKSELLTTMVAALAAAYPPERLSFLLVDYKGGTAFGRLTTLPHVTGVITDLDGALAQRALASLRSELRHREQRLRDGVPRASLGRFVVVVDEFRVLAEEQPDVLSGLVRVATLGRGLGVHLVLATQRPGGVVSPEIRANSDLRIALRLREPSDSHDVLDAPDAARLPAEAPGRALLRRANGALVPVQVAHLCTGAGCAGSPVVTAATSTTAAGIRVTRLHVDPRVPSRWQEPRGQVIGDDRLGEGDDDGRPDDLGRLLVGVLAAARLLGSAPQSAPWLAPLPGLVPLQELAPDRNGPVLALADRPDEREQAALAWDLHRDGHLAVAGAARSGRSTLLRTLAVAAGRVPDVEVHALDAGGRLADLEALPWVGTVVPAGDHERAVRLLERLAPRTAADPRRTLLLVDGWESLEEAWSRLDHGRGLEQLVSLARDGTAKGLRVAVSGGRALFAGGLAGLFTARIVLGATDPSLALVAGVPPGVVLGAAPPGRLLHQRDGGPWVEAQAALVEDVANLVSSPAWTGPEALRPRPLRLVPLPASVGPRALVPQAIGIGGDEAAPLPPPVAGSGDGALVCGPDGSGRSTALARWAQAVTAVGGGGAVLVSQRPAAVGRLRVLDPTTPGSPALLDRLLLDGPALLLDDGWARLPWLEEAAVAYLESGGGSGRGGQVVATCTPTESAVAFRGLVAALRRSRTGLLLGPRGPADGDALGVRLPAAAAGPPGRGVLVERGASRPIQVALPDDTVDAASCEPISARTWEAVPRAASDGRSTVGV